MEFCHISHPFLILFHNKDNFNFSYYKIFIFSCLCTHFKNFQQSQHASSKIRLMTAAEQAERALLAEMRRIKKLYCGEKARLSAEDAVYFEAGMREMKKLDAVLSLQQVISNYLDAKSSLSQRSRAEYGTYLRRILRLNPDMGQEKLAEISPEAWEAVLQHTYPTPAGRNKGRRLIHGLYEYAIAKKWAAHNPVRRVSVEIEPRRELCVLSPEQIQTMLQWLLRPKYMSIAPAVGFMLWDGLRPCDISRTRWEDLQRDLLPPALKRWLDRLPQQYHGPIAPANWAPQWRYLRQAAGLIPWKNDTLRHTYAVYHLKRYNNPHILTRRFKRMNSRQILRRFGHYNDISPEDVQRFWAGNLF